MVHLPAQARHDARGANQQGRLFQEAVIRNQAQRPGLDVRGAVHRVHQQTKGALVEGDGHGVDGEVAAAEVFLNGGGMIDGLAGLGILDAVGADQIDANGAGKTQVKGAGNFVLAPHGATEVLNRFLEFESISMHGQFQRADGVAAGQIAHRVAG